MKDTCGLTVCEERQIGKGPHLKCSVVELTKLPWPHQGSEAVYSDK
jgi:hypothetical protein